MAVSAAELEALHELEGEYESEWEGELESEAFFGRLASLASRAIQSPALQRVGRAAGQAALGALSHQPGTLGQVGRLASGLLGEAELELEGELELESELNPIRRVYPDALMEHLGHAAAEAESEAEAEAFIGALVPLAARLLPRVAPTIMRAAPQLIRGLAGAAQTLRANPATRPLVRTLPTAMVRTAASLARSAPAGGAVSPRAATVALARQTAQTIGSPRLASQAFRRSCALDRRFHQAAGAAR